MPTRLALGAFLGLSAWALAPSVWPLVWFVAMCASQAVDKIVFRPLTADDHPVLSPARHLACLASAASTTAVYSAIAAYMWLRGGNAGQVFAFVQIAGGLLHVALHMHHVRPMLLAASAPHASYLFGLPLLAGFAQSSGQGLPQGIVAMGAALYLAHLVSAVKQSSATTAALVAERERAERASNAKTEFLATVSHEIRTPMNAVISAANLLKRTELTRSQDEHVSMLLNASDVLMGLLNDVLDLSKIEAGRMTLEEADLDLEEKLRSLSDLWRPRAESKGVELTLELDASLPAWVRTDPLRLQQILFNLLSNAVKFTDAGQVTLAAGARSGRLWFEVRDTGCGIADDCQERVFASFEQAAAGVSRSHGGTGLGLAISRRLAELMGGRLSLRSAAGEGSCFRLDLPLAVAAEAAGPASAAWQADGSAPTLSVLVAEDHEVNHRILQLFLEPLGWRLTQAWTGQEAVEAAAAEPFDVILMDMQMPVMSGLDAAAVIRDGGGPNATTPVVALTAAALDHNRQAWAAIGVHRFLTKPIQPKLLIETLLQVADADADQAPQARAA